MHVINYLAHFEVSDLSLSRPFATWNLREKNVLKRMISAVSGDVMFKYMCLSSNNSCNVSVIGPIRMCV